MADHDHPKPVTRMLYDSAPSSRQAVKFMTAVTICGALLLLSGLTLTGTVLALVMATPLLVLFSPILVPAGIALFLVTTGFVFSGGFGVTAISALTWIYSYVSGKHPVGADQLDHIKMMLMDRARDVADKAKEVGQYVQDRGQEVTERSEGSQGRSGLD